MLSMNGGRCKSWLGVGASLNPALHEWGQSSKHLKSHPDSCNHKVDPGLLNSLALNLQNGCPGTSRESWRSCTDS